MTKIKKDNVRKVTTQLFKKAGKSKKEIVGKIKAHVPKNTVKSKKDTVEKPTVQISEKSVKKKKDGSKKSAKKGKENIDNCDEIKEEIVEDVKQVIENTSEEMSEAFKFESAKVFPFQEQLEELVKEAISVLKKLNQHHSGSTTKKPLLDDVEENPVFLQVQLHKIPSKHAKQMIKIKLPHSLLAETSEVCLITGDLDKKDKKAEIEPTVLHYKELLKSHNVNGVTQVVPLRQLRTEYKTFETKRQLAAAYDVFLCDQKICGVLPKLLGKAFYRKRKFPVSINMNTKNIKEQVEKALCEIVFSVSGHGNSCASEVARLSMKDDEILENILASIKTLRQNLSGNFKNIQGLYIKTARSEAIPIYMSYDVPEMFKKAKKPREKNVKEEELSTLPGAKVKVYKDGRIRVIRTDENSDSEAESNDKPQMNVEEALPKSPKVKKETNKAKKRKVTKEDLSAEEDNVDENGESEEEPDVKPVIETKEVLPKSPKVKKEMKNKSEKKKRKVTKEDLSAEEDNVDQNGESEEEPDVKPVIKTKEVLPKSPKAKKEMKNKAEKKTKKQKVVKEENCDSENESMVKQETETEDVLPKSSKNKAEKKNKAKKQKVAKGHSVQED